MPLADFLPEAFLLRYMENNFFGNFNNFLQKKLGQFDFCIYLCT